MKLYEFEGKELFKKSILVGSPEDPPKNLFVVKSQLLSGKRGKAGVVKVCSSCEEVEKSVKEFLGKKVNNEEIKKDLLEEEFDLKKSQALAKKAGFPEKSAEIILNLFSCFKKFDCRVAEINPLVETPSGFFAADSKIVLDDDALFKHADLVFPPRTAGGKQLTKLEEEAKHIDKDDYRGTAGSSFIELDGDIAILASGGGASITCVDALIGYGGGRATM